MKQHYVYRYIDNNDDKIKYIGITSRPLKQRIEEHKKNEQWEALGSWRIEYFIVDTKSQSEAWESHLIALYQTDKWYNKAKSGWGKIKQFMPVKIKWRIYSDNNEVVDIPYEKLPVLKNFEHMISGNEICLTFDLIYIDLLKMCSRKVIQPLAKTIDDDLLFWETDIEKIINCDKSNYL